MFRIVLLVAVAIAAGAQALTEAQEKLHKKYTDECVTISGVDPELLAKAHNGDFVDDAKLKEHLFCFSKKAGFQTENGDIKFDVVKAKLGVELKNPALADQLMSKCVIKKVTPQQTAFDTFKCLHEANPDLL